MYSDLYSLDQAYQKRQNIPIEQQSFVHDWKVQTQRHQHKVVNIPAKYITIPHRTTRTIVIVQLITAV